jgi:hypothetical protein
MDKLMCGFLVFVFLSHDGTATDILIHQLGWHSPHFGVDTEVPSSLVSGNCKEYKPLLNY